MAGRSSGINNRGQQTRRQLCCCFVDAFSSRREPMVFLRLRFQGSRNRTGANAHRPRVRLISINNRSECETSSARTGPAFESGEFADGYGGVHIVSAVPFGPKSVPRRQSPNPLGGRMSRTHKCWRLEFTSAWHENSIRPRRAAPAPAEFEPKTICSARWYLMDKEKKTDSCRTLSISRVQSAVRLGVLSATTFVKRVKRLVSTVFLDLDDLRVTVTRRSHLKQRLKSHGYFAYRNWTIATNANERYDVFDIDV